MLRVGVIGLGVIAKYYLDAIERAPGVELAVACDCDPAKLRAFERAGVRTTRSYAEAVAGRDLDAVVVNVPNHLHGEVCRRALDAGRHVCCEKPLVLGAGEAQALQLLAERAGRVLFCALHRRYNRHVRRLAAWTAGQAPLHGGVAACRVRYLERIEEHCGEDRWYLDPRAAGGGCIADNGPNAFDVAELLLGPCEVIESRVWRRAGVDVRADVVLRAESGARAEIELDWAFDGEVKDASVSLGDGMHAAADMLEGYTEFKSSLVHEYDEILRDFAGAVRGEDHEGGRGPRLVRLVGDAYARTREAGTAARGRVTAEPELADKRAVEGVLVKLLRHRRADRGMALMPERSRCVRRGELHELVVTDADPGPGDVVDRVGFLGFVEITVAGVLDAGDELVVAGRRVGVLLGFDGCHAPNHLNVVVRAGERLTATDLRLAVGDPLAFAPTPDSLLEPKPPTRAVAAQAVR